MNITKLLGTVCCCAVFGSLAYAGAQDELKAYPQAKSGYVRQVIILPALNNENDAKLELMIGRTIETDCNTRGFGGNLVKKTVSGWGYDYLVLDKLKGPVSTMMACSDNTRKRRFVSMNNVPLQRYNSKLPVVVYVPTGVEVRYRVWYPKNKIGTAKIQ